MSEKSRASQPGVQPATAPAHQERQHSLVAARPARLYARSRALIIGACNYESGWPALPGVAQDVAEVACALEEHEFELTTVIDPDHQRLGGALDDFLLDGKIEEKDRLLIYYAGHGYTWQSPQGLKTGYLVPVDAPTPRTNGFRRKLLSLDYIHMRSRDTAANHVLFLFDSCFSGELLESARSRGVEPPVHIEEHVRRPVRQFITAGEADESVPDRSIFRAYFVQALRGEADLNDDGFFTGSQLADYLFDKVVTNSAKRQHPQHAKTAVPGLEKGDFVFEVPHKWIVQRTRPPKPPSARPGFEKLEQVAAELEPQQRDSEQQWDLWLEDMRRDFHKSLEYESKNVPSRLKIAYWSRFLDGYSAAHPFSTVDRELRDQARRRIEALERATSASAAVRAVASPGEVREDSPLKIRFRSIPPSRFHMGSPEEERDRNADEVQHDVRLTRGFWIAETAVTQGQWEALMDNNPSYFASGGHDCPVERVSWYSALLFANRLSESSDLAPCYELLGRTDAPDGKLHFERVVFRGLECSGFRLPTEAEWELAARAGTRSPFWTGNELTTDEANYDGNFPYGDSAPGVFRQRTTPVRSFKPNPWGLYDVHGNVAEWVWDIYGGYPAGEVVDPLGANGPTSATSQDFPRLIRGGGWLDAAGGCRSADRLPAAPGYRDSNVGFRLVRSFPTTNEQR